METLKFKVFNFLNKIKKDDCVRKMASVMVRRQDRNFMWVRFCSVPWFIITETRLLNGSACI